MPTQSEVAHDSLVQLLRNSKGIGTADKPLLWLGAGASAFDGMPLGDELVLRLVGAGGAWGTPQYRLDRLFGNLQARARLALLKPLLDMPLSSDSPYHTVVRLLVEGHLGGVVTFNVDELMEQAIHAAAVHSRIGVLDGVEMVPSAITERFRARDDERRLVLKLHGGLTTGLNLFTSAEISEYTSKLAGTVEMLSRRPAVVCGYSFAHLNVLRAFSIEPGAFFYCNPDGPNTVALLSLMERRGGVFGNVLDGNMGRFEVLMAALERDLALGGQVERPR